MQLGLSLPDSEQLHVATAFQQPISNRPSCGASAGGRIRLLPGPHEQGQKDLGILGPFDLPAIVDGEIRDALHAIAVGLLDFAVDLLPTFPFVQPLSDLSCLQTCSLARRNEASREEGLPSSSWTD